MRVYLSGGMEYADGEGLHWRRDLQQWIEHRLGHEVFNPNVESERFFSSQHPGVDFRSLKLNNLDEYQRIVRKLVEIDCKEIADRSDYVVCLWDESAMRGAGTKGELTMAHFFQKPVYFVTRIPHHEIPGWVLGCVTQFFPSFENLHSFLLEKFLADNTK